MTTCASQNSDPDQDSELTSEEVEDLDRRVAQLRQSWDDRLQFSDLSLIKNYLAGHVQIHLHGLINPAEGVPKEFCAVFGGPRERLDQLGVRQPEGDISLSWVNANSMGRHDGHKCYKKEPVLFGVVELVKDEDRRLFGFTFLVGLDALDQCQRAAGDTLYYSVAQRLFVFGRRLADGEANSARIGVAPQHKRPYQMVQGASEVMEDFTRNDCKSKRNDMVGSLIEDFYNAQSSIAVDIGADAVSVRVRVGKPLEFSCKIADMLIGPFNLRPTTVHGV